MSTPVVPTVNTLLTEAYRRCGVPVPTVAQLQRAKDEWLEEVKRDISADKRWHALEETMVMIPQAYIQIYPLPSPLIRVTTMRFYRGGAIGTATGGAAASITIASGTGTDEHLGRKIFLTSGTGVAQVNRIISRSGDTYTVGCTWTTAPIAGTGYMIPDIEREVCGPEAGLPLSGKGPSNEVRAYDYHEGNLRLYPVLDNSNSALELDGIVDLSLVDEADARLTRILREWRAVLVRGVIVKIKEDQDDAEVDRDERKYEKEKTKLMRQDSQKRRRLAGSAFRTMGGLPRGRYF